MKKDVFKISIVILLILLIILLPVLREKTTTFEEIISEKIDNRDSNDIDTLLLFIFRYNIENTKEHAHDWNKTTKEKDKINSLTNYINTFSLQETKNTDRDHTTDDTKFVILFYFEDNQSIEITTRDYQNLQIAIELSNNRVIRKNYKIVNDKLDSNYLEDVFDSI